MALFKYFQGSEADLAKVPYHEGYGYFIPGTYDYENEMGTISHLGGKLFFDEGGARYQVDAHVAEGLYDSDGNYHPADEFFSLNEVLSVDKGGTGATTVSGIVIGTGNAPFTGVEINENDIVLGDAVNGVKGFTPRKNALIMGAAGGLKNTVLNNNRVVLGDTTNGVKEFQPANNAIIVGDTTNGLKNRAIAEGHVVLGDSTNGVKGLAGKGALYASTSGSPQFGTLPLALGGTGATDAAGGRTNLDVYSKDEVDTKVKKATATAVNAKLEATKWKLNTTTGLYEYTVNTPNLTCGSDGTVPPLIANVSNPEEYNNIISADATANTNVVFTIKEIPAQDIDLVIVDIK